MAKRKVVTKERNIPDALVSEGWLTPNTYSNHFAEIEDEPAVYLFLVYPQFDFTNALVAYVGMSVKLRQRLASHNILPELDKPGVYVQRWFKPTAPSLLRKVEAKYITRFDPPWNIIGRPRGAVLN